MTAIQSTELTTQLTTHNLSTQTRHTTQTAQTTDHPFFTWCVKVYKNHSDLVSQLSILALNTTVLAGRIFQSIPKFVTHCAFTAYNFIGLISLNMQGRDLVKSGKDLIAAIIARDYESIVFTAAKVAVKALDILLTCTLFSAAIISLIGFPQIALGIYTILLPFSIFSLVTGIGTYIYDYEKSLALSKTLSRDLSNRVSVISNNQCNNQSNNQSINQSNNQSINQCNDKCNNQKSDEQIKKITDTFFDHLNDKRTTETCAESLLGRHIYWNLEYYAVEKIKEDLLSKDPTRRLTLEQIIPKISMDDRRALLKQILDDLNRKKEYTQNNVGLIAVGYVALGIGKIWPNTLLQSSVTWCLSLFYTLNLLNRKFGGECSTVTGS